MKKFRKFKMPKCKEQISFEDLIVSLAEVLAELSKEDQYDIFEYAQTVAFSINRKQKNNK